MFETTNQMNYTSTSATTIITDALLTLPILVLTNIVVTRSDQHLHHYHQGPHHGHLHHLKHLHHHHRHFRHQYHRSHVHCCRGMCHCHHVYDFVHIQQSYDESAQATTKILMEKSRGHVPLVPCPSELSVSWICLSGNPLCTHPACSGGLPIFHGTKGRCVGSSQLPQKLHSYYSNGKSPSFKEKPQETINNWWIFPPATSMLDYWRVSHLFYLAIDESHLLENFSTKTCTTGLGL